MLAQGLSMVSGKTRRCAPLRAKTSSGFRAELLRGTLVGESQKLVCEALELKPQWKLVLWRAQQHNQIQGP